VLLKGFGMLHADRMGGKNAKSATNLSSSEGGSDGKRKCPARGDNGE
jgi:hypothetical protein